MTNFQLTELHPVANELLSDSDNHVNQLSESEMNSINGGYDLEPAAKDIFKTVGTAFGEAITIGLGDLFF